MIPTIILIAMAWPASQALIEMYDTGGEDMTVEVRGYQWKWQYKYLDADYNQTFAFFSNLATPADEIHNRSVKGEYYLLEVDNPLRIPAFTWSRVSISWVCTSVTPRDRCLLDLWPRNSSKRL